MNEASKDADLSRIRNACIALGEHYDSVQIFVNRHEQGENDGTINISLGSGNWFARYGQVKSWIVKQEERDRLNARNEAAED